MNVVLRMSGQHHTHLKAHLFPGDNKEAVAILLCGRRRGEARHCLSVYEVFPVPYDACVVREPDRVTWPTEVILPALDKADKNGLALVKIHSHPGGYDAFSWVDDEADKDLLPSVYSWCDCDDSSPHGSAIMLPDGKIFGRVVTEAGKFLPFECVAVAGDDLSFWFTGTTEDKAPETQLRTKQAFGAGTLSILKRLSVAVVGCSGTGGPVIEQFARYGVGKLVLVDPEVVEDKNLNRIPNTSKADAKNRRPKVLALARAIKRMGLGTQVVPIVGDLNDPEVIKAVAECDVIFGCMDSVDGRHILNKLASTYAIPYFDVGVKLIADGQGGIDHIGGTVHYLQPDRSSLLSRGVYTIDQVRASALKRSNPDVYQKLLEEKYIKGVNEDRPAVVSVNTFYASLAVLEFLARIHRYRDDANGKFAVNRITLNDPYIYNEPEGERCAVVTRYAGRGDMKPLLNMPGL